MINAKEAPRYKGLKIFFFFLLAMVGGFLRGELRLKADALTSSVGLPDEKQAALTPRGQAVLLAAEWQDACAFDLANASYQYVVPEVEPQFCTTHRCEGHPEACCPTQCTQTQPGTPHVIFMHVEKTGGSSIECAWQQAQLAGHVSLLGHGSRNVYDTCHARCEAAGVPTLTMLAVREPYSYWASVYAYAWQCLFGACVSIEAIDVMQDANAGVYFRDNSLALNESFALNARIDGAADDNLKVQSRYLCRDSARPCQRGVLASFAKFMRYVSTSPLWRGKRSQTHRVKSRCGDPCVVDEVLHTETLTNDWQRLLCRYPGLPRIALPRINDQSQTDSSHPWGTPPPATYTAEVVRIVNDMDRWIFDRFGYPMNATDDAGEGGGGAAVATGGGEIERLRPLLQASGYFERLYECRHVRCNPSIVDAPSRLGIVYLDLLDNSALDTITRLGVHVKHASCSPPKDVPSMTRHATIQAIRRQGGPEAVHNSGLAPHGCWNSSWRERRNALFTLPPGSLFEVADLPRDLVPDNVLFIAPSARPQPVRNGSWVEVTHCARLPPDAVDKQFMATHDGVQMLRKDELVGENTNGDVLALRTGPAWFYVATGSGVSINVGKTLVLDEYALVRGHPSSLGRADRSPTFSAGIDSSFQLLADGGVRNLSLMMAHFWEPRETPLTRFLNLTHRERMAYDSVQRIRHHEFFSVMPYHEILIKPTHMNESAPITSASEALLQCGIFPHLRPCEPSSPGVRLMSECHEWMSRRVIKHVDLPPDAHSDRTVCDQEPEHFVKRIDYVFWVHIPKTGTSFGNVITHYANSSLPADARMSTCDKHGLSHNLSVDADPSYRLNHPYEPHVCSGATDGFFQRYPHSTWFRGMFAVSKQGHSTTDCDAGAHAPITDALWLEHSGHFQGLFRSPLRLMPSVYLRQARNPGDEAIVPPSRDLAFNTAEGAESLLRYARSHMGLMVRFLTGTDISSSRRRKRPHDTFAYTAHTTTPRADLDTGAVTMDQARRAVARLDGFSFVGITDEWEQTICLYHRMIMKDRPCLAVEFENNRKSAIGNTTLGGEVLDAAGWADQYDQMLWEAVQRIFYANVERFEVNEKSCAAILCTASSHQSGALIG